MHGFLVPKSKLCGNQLVHTYSTLWDGSVHSRVVDAWCMWCTKISLWNTEGSQSLSMHWFLSWPLVHYPVWQPLFHGNFTHCAQIPNLHPLYCTVYSVTVFHHTEHLIVYLFSVLQNTEKCQRSWLVVILFHSWTCCHLHIYCRSSIWLGVTFSGISYFMQDFFMYEVWQMTRLISHTSLY